MPPETEAARLYDTFGASLFRYALMILANREAAEDVIQQVFLVLLDGRAGRIEDEERFLRRSVRNACYSAIRHQKIRMGPPADESLLEAVGQGPAVSEEDRLALWQAIGQLPPDQREVIHLHLFEGWTFKETAVLIGEPLNTAASRYRYAIEKIRATLTKAKP
jgi:RNA polymerase sigma-70 factor (ECF subfamily)